MAATDALADGAHDAPVFESLRLAPMGVRHVGGLASSFDNEFPEELDGVIDPGTYEEGITRVNNALIDHWPCNACTGFAYGCCLCTLGFSFWYSARMVNDAEKYCRQMIDRVNNSKRFLAAEVSFELHHSCCSSWVEVRYPVGGVARSSV